MLPLLEVPPPRWLQALGTVVFSILLSAGSSCSGGPTQTLPAESQRPGESEAGRGNLEPSADAENCAEGTEPCTNGCRNLDIDPANCGACDNACSDGEACTDGTCSTTLPASANEGNPGSCGEGLSSCGAACRNLSFDAMNCGSCNNACASGESCRDGACGVFEASPPSAPSPDTATPPQSGPTASSEGCGETVTINPYPMGCTFAWGAPNEGNRANTLDFVSGWVGYEERGGLDGACDGCRTAGELASSNALLVFYAYFIGYQANLLGGFGDCNLDFDGQNLCTDGAQWIRDNRALVVEMYGEYARRVYEASPEKPVIWWLEGDYVQYSYDDQSNPLSMSELGELAREITCAIKANQPNAVVAMNHSPWVSDEQANEFWDAMPMDVIDLVWVAGAGNNDGYTRPDFNAQSYNALTNNYAFLSQKTGRPVMAETSFAFDGNPDSWTDASQSELDERISEGVIGVLINNPGPDLESAVTSAQSGLAPVCE